MTSRHTHYDNLKVARNAPPEVIRAAYKSLAQKYHPDKHSDPIEAERIIKIINAAYETLMNPEARARYDIELGREEAKNTATSVPPVTSSPVAKYSPKPTESTNTHYFKAESESPFIASQKVILPMAIYGLIILFLAIFAAMLINVSPTEQQKVSNLTHEASQTTPPSTSNIESLNNNQQQISERIVSTSTLPTDSSHAPDQSVGSVSVSKNTQIMRSDQASQQTKSPTYQNISYEHAEELFQDNRFIEADLMVDALLTQSPNYAAAWRLKGMLQASRGNTEAATKAFSTYLQASNNSEESIAALKNLSSGKSNMAISIQQAARQALNNVGKE